MSWRETGDLTIPEVNELLDAANVIEAQEQMLRLDAHAFGHADKKGRQKIMKRYHKIAHPNNHKKAPVDIHKIQALLNNSKIQGR